LIPEIEAGVIGRTILAVNVDDDGLHFRLDSEWWFSAFNAAVLTMHGSQRDSKELLGRTVVQTIHQEGVEFLFILDDGFQLAISLRDADYRGPEALNFCSPASVVYPL
jgi:hypothetical protein